MSCSSMTTESASKERQLHEGAVTDQFLNDPSEESLSALVRVFVSQLVAFFRARGRKHALAEDLAQQVMLTVYRKAGQIRDRSLISCMAIQDRPQRALPARGPTYAGSGDSESGRRGEAFRNRQPEGRPSSAVGSLFLMFESET
jgi:hypothetical protein